MVVASLRSLVLACSLVGLLVVALPASSLFGLDDEPSTDPAVVGAWSEPIEGEKAAVNMVLLHDGRVLYWSGAEADDTDSNTEATFFTSDPIFGESRVIDFSGQTPVVTTPTNPRGDFPDGGDLFCAGQTILPDGRVLTIGSSHWEYLPRDPDVTLYGGNDAQVFDPTTDSWVRVDDMEVGRWYPTITKLSDGSALATSGIGQLYNPLEHQTLVERFDLETETWEEAGDRLLPLYPRIHSVPGGPMKGDAFYSTVGTLWGPFGEHPLEAQWNLQQAYDTETGAWRFLGPSVLGVRQHAATIMMPLSPDNDYAPELVTFGGTLQRSIVANPFTEVADLSTEPPTNRLAGNLNEARWHHNGVLLPDGHILAVGGAVYDNVVVHGQEDPGVYGAEWFDADAGTWDALAPMTLERGYHSTAILLPDARVLVGGHVPLPIPVHAARQSYDTPAGPVEYEPQEVETRFEVYSPPYLFRGERPEIATLSEETVGYGDEIAAALATLGDATHVDSVVLVHPSATTHANDMTQRSIELVFTQTGNALHVTLPPDADVAPPGHYMVFVNGATDDGVIPSEAAWVHLS